jgi:CTP synthase (EC 6.3.4.2)
VLRTEHDLSLNLRKKVALFCNVDPAAVIQSIDVPTIYEVPLKMHQQHLDELVLTKTGLPINGEPHLEPWMNFLHRMKCHRNGSYRSGG